MVFFSNSTTKRLEAHSRRLGRNLHIVKAIDNMSGVFFATGEDGKAWTSWHSLGWTRDEAASELDRMCEKEKV